MTGCTPPSGTVSGTAYVLACETDAKHVALVWDDGADIYWLIPHIGGLHRADIERPGYRYLGPLTMPAAVDALRAENARLLAALTGAFDAMDDPPAAYAILSAALGHSRVVDGE